MKLILHSIMCWFKGIISIFEFDSNLITISDLIIRQRVNGMPKNFKYKQGVSMFETGKYTTNTVPKSPEVNRDFEFLTDIFCFDLLSFFIIILRSWQHLYY